MRYKVFYTIPEQYITIEADNEYEAGEKAQYAIDGLTIEKSFRFNEVDIVGIEDIEDRNARSKQVPDVPDSPSLEDDSYYGTLIDIQNHELGGR